MPINWRAMKERFDKRAAERARRGRVTYLQTGRNVVRLMHMPKGVDMPFAEGGKHFNLDILGLDAKIEWCPRVSKNRDCPICEKVSQLYDSVESEEDRKQLSRLSPSYTYLFPVVIRGKEDMGPKLLEVPDTVFGDIMNHFGIGPDVPEDERLDLTHWKTGKDIVITKTPKSQYGSDYSVKPKPAPTPLGTSAQVKEWLKAYPDPEEYIDSQLKSYDQLKAMFEASAEEEVDDISADLDDSSIDVDTEGGLEELPDTGDDLEELPDTDEDDLEEPTEEAQDDIDLDELGEALDDPDDLEEDDLEVVDGVVVEKTPDKKPSTTKPTATKSTATKADAKTGDKPADKAKGARKTAAEIAAEIRAAMERQKKKK